MFSQWRKYLHFSKSQSIAIVLLLGFAFLFLVLQKKFINIFNPISTPQNSAWIEQCRANVYIDSNPQFENTQKNNLKPFVFNPNELDKDGFIRLGFTEKLANTICNYRNKGGHFYKKQDFKKIWGLDAKDYAILEPYIQLPSGENQFENNHYKPEKKNIEINAASVADWESLYGIGEKLADNIIKYKESLGGFYSIQQIQEVYGIRPETYDKIKAQLYCNPAAVKKLNINYLELKELQKHPYLRQNNLAEAMVNFRKTQDYEIKKLEDLKKIPQIDEATFKKLLPYLVLH